MRFKMKRACVVMFVAVAQVSHASEMKPEARRVVRPADMVRARTELAMTQLLAKAVVLGTVSVLMVLPVGDRRLPVAMLRPMTE